MTTLPWDILLERCAGATEAVIAAPYIKVAPLSVVMDQLGPGASVDCYTRWTPQDIQTGVSDLECRATVVERGGSFRLHNRLHAKYYRFDERVLIGSANMTAAGLSYLRQGNLEILCEPGPPFAPAAFEAALKRDSTEVSDGDFRVWQQCPVIERDGATWTGDITESSLNEWKPQTRNPVYLWLCYSGAEEEIVSGEQRALATLDLQALGVPQGLMSESFNDWICLSLRASPFMDSVRQFGGRTDAVAWDSVAAEWGVSRSLAARWVSTSYNWLKYFEPSADSQAGEGTQTL